MDIYDEQKDAADEVFDSFDDSDFGYLVVDYNGWDKKIDRDTGDASLSRIVFLEPHKPDDNDSIKCVFKVDFVDDSSNPRSATAYIGNHTVEWFPQQTSGPQL